MTFISKRSSIFGLTTLAIVALSASFQNCSSPLAGQEYTENPSVSSNTPSVSIQASPQIWRVGSSDTVSIQYTTRYATSVSGYHVFNGTCSLGQSQGGQRISWAWPDTVGQKTWTHAMSDVSDIGRDDRGCTVQYCVVARNTKGSSEACATIQVVDVNAPTINLSMTPSQWRLGSGEALNASYTVSNATSTRGYHTFQGTCAAAQQYAGQQVAWDFGNNVNGNTWSGVANAPAAGDRDDRGCTITYCVVATNSSGSVESCVPIRVTGNTPKVSISATPDVWNVNSGQSVTISYTNQNATASRGYHVFSGTCSMATQYPGQQLAWDFGSNVTGNSWTGTPSAVDRDDRGCSINYCIVASNSEGETEACKSVTVQ